MSEYGKVILGDDIADSEPLLADASAVPSAVPSQPVVYVYDANPVPATPPVYGPGVSYGPPPPRGYGPPRHHHHHPPHHPPRHSPPGNSIHHYSFIDPV